MAKAQELFSKTSECVSDVLRKLSCEYSRAGVSNSFSPGDTSAFKWLNVILGHINVTTPLQLSKSSMLLPGRNKMPSQIKQGGGPD